MYTPPGVNVFPVPLKQLNWSYSITAVPAGKALKQLGAAVSPNANNFVTSVTEPLWKHVAAAPTQYVSLAQVDYSGN
jgi:hypothetical protein